MRGRLWCFTINNYTDDDIVDTMSMGEEEARYMILGFEVGEKCGTPHIQGFVYFDNARSQRAVSKMVPRASLRLCRGSFKDNVEYCSKDDNVYVSGEELHPGIVDRARIEDIMSNPWENFSLFCQYRRAYNELKNMQLIKHEPSVVLCPVHKRFTLARESFASNSVSMYGSEYDGEQVIMRNVYDSCVDLYLESWLNGYPVKYKNGYEYRYWNPECVVLLYADAKAYNYAMKMYGDYVIEVLK